MSVTRTDARHASSPTSAADGRDDRERRPTPLEVAVVGAIVAVGVVLRFVATSPLWLDEALSVNIAHLSLGDIPGALRQDGLPPLYYVLLHAWMIVVGSGDLAVRSLSGILGVAALPLAYTAGRRLGGPRVGLVALALLAASPFAIRYATEARMYSLLVLLVLVGWHLLRAIFDRVRTVHLIGLALVVGALLLTHYWSFWLVGGTAVVLAVLWWRGPEPMRRPAGLSLGAVAAGGALFLPWMPIFLDQLAHTGTPWATPVRPTTWVALTVADWGAGAGRLRDGEVLGWALAMLALLGLFARAVDDRRLVVDLRTVPPARPEAAVIGLTAVLGVAASWLASAGYQSRYAAGLVPLVLLLAALGLTRLGPARLQVAVLAVVAVLGLGLASWNARTDRTQAGVIAEAIRAESTPTDDLVVFCPDQLGPAVNRLLPVALDQVTYPRLESPERIDWVDYVARHRNTDPAAFADAVLDRASPEGSIWLVSSASYRGVDEQCDVLRDALASERPAEQVVAEDGESYYEHAALWRFGPP